MVTFKKSDRSSLLALYCNHTNRFRRFEERQMRYSAKAGLAIVACLVAGQMPAAAYAQQTTFAQLKNVATGRCLNTPSKLIGQEMPVSISSCKSPADTSQTVQFVKVRDDKWSIRNADGNACLNLKSSTENKNGGHVKWVGCSTHTDQLWTLTAKLNSGPSQNEVRNVGSGKCLEVRSRNENRDGGRAAIYTCSNSADVRWTWSNSTAAAPRISLNDLKIASHNVWFMTILGTNIGKYRGYQDVSDIEARARAIVADGYLKGQDILVLNELFDNGASNILLNGLRSEYEHQTAVAGRSSEGGRDNWDNTSGDYRRRARLEAGVAILSKWPIEHKEQYLFPHSDLCGYDARANKGFAYARINYKTVQKVHVIATHLQSEDTGCGGANDTGYTAGHRERARQLTAIKRFLNNKRIPASEPIFVVGDMNVIMYLREYKDMLATLGAREPKFTGNAGTYDGTDNPLVGNNNLPQILDYVLSLKGHAAPNPWFTEIRKKNGMADHYPVFASSQKRGNDVNPYVTEFYIRIHTSNRFQSGTDSNIIAVLNDASGRQSRRFTLNGRISGNAFERGDVDTIKLEANALTSPVSVTIESDGDWPGADWRISKIEILDAGARPLKAWTGDYEFRGESSHTFELR